MRTTAKSKKWDVFTWNSPDPFVIEAEDCEVDELGYLRFFDYSDSIDDPEYYQKHVFAPGQWLSFREAEDHPEQKAPLVDEHARAPAGTAHHSAVNWINISGILS